MRASLQFLITFLFVFFFFFFLVPGLRATSPAATTTTCKESTCSSNMNSPRIRFPFRLQNIQSEWCGYNGFDLSCGGAPEWRTNLNLPSSGEFIVKEIYYVLQKLWITNADSCFPRLFLHNNFSLIGSPFSNVHALVNFTFINCSYVPDSAYVPISCLSKVDEYIIGVPSTWYDSETQKAWSSFCSVIATAFVPFGDPFGWEDLDINGLELAWFTPDCHFCEGPMDKVCEPASSGSTQLTCSSTITGTLDKGMEGGVKYGIMLSVGITVMFMFILMLARRLQACGSVDRSNTLELSAITTGEPTPVFATGLDAQTIESYPKTQLGEVWELPKPNDNTCSICLSEYKANDVLRGIPECSHYFHVNCIDEWLRRNATCPLCRNPSDTSNKVVEA